MKKFKLVDHTADVGIIAYAKNIKDLFANAAYGMFSIIADLNKISDEKSIKLTINLSADNPEELLIIWLNELLYNYNTKKLFFTEFDIEIIDNTHLFSTVCGIKITSLKHKIKTEIKAATYHQVKIIHDSDKNKNKFWQARIFFDV